MANEKVEEKEIKAEIPAVASIPEPTEAATLGMVLRELRDLRVEINQLTRGEGYVPFSVRNDNEVQYHTGVATALKAIKENGGRVYRIEEDKIDNFWICNLFADLDKEYYSAVSKAISEVK